MIVKNTITLIENATHTRNGFIKAIVSASTGYTKNGKHTKTSSTNIKIECLQKRRAVDSILDQIGNKKRLRNVTSDQESIKTDQLTQTIIWSEINGVVPWKIP